MKQTSMISFTLCIRLPIGRYCSKQYEMTKQLIRTIKQARTEILIDVNKGKL